MSGKEDHSQVVLYQTDDGKVRVDVAFQEETAWLSQDQMAELFGKAKSTINEHIKNVYQEKELSPKETMRKFGISEFMAKPTNFYNLDVIISVGYRVKSVSMYLDFAELQATNGRLMRMADWIEKLDQFLQISEKKLLHNAGSVSADDAAAKAREEFEKYREIREKNLVSDFDRAVKEIEKKGKSPRKKGGKG